MIPTSTDVTIALKDELPDAAEVVAVLVHKETKAGDDALAGLPDDVGDAVESLVTAGDDAGQVERAHAAVARRGDGRSRRLLVVGLGARPKFSGQCARGGRHAGEGGGGGTSCGRSP